MKMSLIDIINEKLISLESAIWINIFKNTVILVSNFELSS
jgi:hypothetical protein